MRDHWKTSKACKDNDYWYSTPYRAAHSAHVHYKDGGLTGNPRKVVSPLLAALAWSVQFHLRIDRSYCGTDIKTQWTRLCARSPSSNSLSHTGDSCPSRAAPMSPSQSSPPSAPVPPSLLRRPRLGENLDSRYGILAPPSSVSATLPELQMSLLTPLPPLPPSPLAATPPPPPSSTPPPVIAPAADGLDREGRTALFSTLQPSL